MEPTGERSLRVFVLLCCQLQPPPAKSTPLGPGLAICRHDEEHFSPSRYLTYWTTEFDAEETANQAWPDHREKTYCRPAGV